MTIELPEHLRTGPMAEAAAKALQDANSMAASSNSVPRLSLKGREFHLIENGEEVAKFRDKLDVIIIGVEPDAGRMIKTFYAKGYTSGAKEPPTCSSDDGIAPAPWVNDKQSQTCQACPKNQFGSATSPNGKPTKACRDSKRIWFKLADSNVMGDGQGGSKPYPVGPFNERTLYGANVTVASLKSFSEHGRQLSAMGQPPAVCVTRLLMVDKEFPELEFKLFAWLGAEEAPLSLKMAEQRPWKIQYKSAGLALAGDGGPTRQALPSSLPGAPPPVPAHLAQGTQTIVDAAPPAPTTPVDTKKIDDAIGNW